MELPQGTFDNEKRYIFNNWSTEDFTALWGGVPTLIKAGETKEFPQYMAYHATKHFVNREMEKAGKSKVAGIDEERKPFEDKTMAAIGDGVDSPALAGLKEKIKQEIENTQKAEKVASPLKAKKEEFAGIK